MDAVRYFKEKYRMCKSFEKCYKGCPLCYLTPEYVDCTFSVHDNPELFVEAVEEWSNNNPVEKDMPFISFSDSEYEDSDTLGECITCERCNEIHKVENGQIKRADGTCDDSNVLQFVKCKGEAYLVGIKGKRLK